MVISNPEFERVPNGDDYQEYFPDRGLRNNINGKVRFQCLVTAKGQLVNCKITSETPADMGFGDATLKIVKQFRVKPKLINGKPVDGGIFAYGITWNVPAE